MIRVAEYRRLWYIILDDRRVRQEVLFAIRLSYIAEQIIQPR